MSEWMSITVGTARGIYIPVVVLFFAKMKPPLFYMIGIDWEGKTGITIMKG